VFHFSEYAIAW